MLELVFGPESTFVPPKDPVDHKLHRLISHTIQQVARNGTVSVVPASIADNTMDLTNTMHSTNSMNGIVVQTTELPDDISLATTAGGYNSTVSSDSGCDNINANSNDVASLHSLQTDAATIGVRKKLKS